MNAIASSIAVMFPGVRAKDIVDATVEHRTSVLIKEQYDPQKNYARYLKNINTGNESETVGINLLFIFSDGSSMVATDRRSISKIMKKVGEIHGCIL